MGHIKNSSFLLIIFAVTVIVAASQAQAQVPLDCIGVQQRAAEQRISSLPSSAQARYAPVVQEIKSLQEDASTQARKAEVAWNELTARARAADPSASDAVVTARMYSLILQSAEHDNKYAEVLWAIYKAHVTEGIIIDKSRAIHTADDARQVTKLANEFASRHPNIGDAATLMQQSQPFRQLASILEANKVATASSEPMPAAALTRVGFDVNGEDVHIAAAAQNTSSLLAKVDTAGQVANLIRGHLEDRLGDRTQRASLMRDGQSQTAQAAASQIARAQNLQLQRGYVVRQISKIESDIERLPPPKSQSEQRTLVGEVAGRVQRQVEKLKRIIIVD